MKSHLKDILVPVDFQVPSINALQYAIELAKFTNGKITILYVIKKLDFISELLRSNDELVKITEQAKSKLDEIADQYGKPNEVEISTRIEIGKIYEKILEVAESIDSRFIVLADDTPDQSERAIGSNVTHITCEAKCPVIVTKGNTKQVFKKIIVPLDLSKDTSRQIFSAIAFGIHYKATIHLVSVVIGGIWLKNSLIYKKMKRVSKTIRENGIECTTKLYSRSEIPPYKRILEYTKEINADIILLMTHQEKRNDNYIGAFAQNLINESDIPLLSLTTSASEIDATKVMQNIVDPLNLIFKSKKR